MQVKIFKMANAEQPFLFFMKSPDLKNLLSFSAEIQFQAQGSGLYLFHKRILKCRELIFSESDIVAKTSNYSKTEIVAIIPKSRFYNAEFQKKLDKMGLTVGKICDVSPALLQGCLQYTATAKLAPQWNNVRDLLVKGRDFLISSGPLTAVKLDIFVNGDEITLSVIPKCIKLPHFKTENYTKAYGLSGNIIAVNEICHVLPSLKKGRVTMLSKSELTTNLFSNYSELKKHWKNMYGYRLPEVSEENIWYITVVFNVPFSTPYTYPSFCVRPSGMIEVRQKDPQSTLHSFISDFCRKVDNVCNQKCQILDRKASFPLLHLYPAQDVTGDATPRIGTTYSMPCRSSTVMRTNDEKPINESQNGMDTMSKQPQGNSTSRNGLNLISTNVPQSSTSNFNVQNNTVLQYRGICKQKYNLASYREENLDTLSNNCFKNDMKNRQRTHENNLLNSGKKKVHFETASNNSITDPIAQFFSGDKITSPKKYAPLFISTLKRKQQVQCLQVTKAFAKANPVKVNRNLQQHKSISTPDKVQKQAFNLKSNSEQIKNSTPNERESLKMSSFYKLSKGRKMNEDGKADSSKIIKKQQIPMQNQANKLIVEKPTRKYTRKLKSVF